MKTSIVVLVIVAFLSQGGHVKGGILDNLVGAVSGVINGAFGTITQFGTGITRPIQGATQIVRNLIQSFANLLAIGLGQTASFTGNVANNVRDVLGGILNGFINVANKIAAGEFSFYRDVIQALFDTLAKGINVVITTVVETAAGVRSVIVVIRDGFRTFIGNINDQVTDCMTKLNALGLSSATNALKTFLWNLTIATNIVQEAIVGQLNSFSTHLNATAWNSTLNATEFIKNITDQIADLSSMPNEAEFQECIKELTDNLTFIEKNIFSDINDCIEKANSTIIGILPNITVIQNATEDALNTVCNCVAGVTLGSLLSQRLEAKVCTEAASSILNTDILKNPISTVTKEVTDLLGEIRGVFDTCTGRVTNQIPGLDKDFKKALEKCIEIGQGG